MPLSLSKWSPSGEQPAVFDMSDVNSWGVLLEEYSHLRSAAPLERIFEIARSHGVACVVREPRYIDADWRSQLARFYNGAFRRYPSVCHRLHFFTEAVDPNLMDLSRAQGAYRGYTVIRPLPVAPVGRTMIAPPPELSAAVRCEGTETVDLYGWPLEIRAMPFISQDTQLLRCAHASAWMVLRHAHMLHRQPYRLPAEIYDAALGGVVVGRQLPSDGLSSHQLLSALTTLGLSPTSKALPLTRDQEAAASSDLRLYAILCRYINSQLPPIVISNTHAWTVVAYERKASNGNPAITLWRHDDAAGPYLRVDDPWSEPNAAHQPWAAAYLPLLPKAYIDAERAEAVGRTLVDQFRKSPAYADSSLAKVDSHEEGGAGATLRTFLIDSSQFKQRLADRGVPHQLAAPLRRTEMSRYLWIIEVVDRAARSAAEPDVLGELILDATLTQFEPLSDPASVAVFHIDTVGWIAGLDGGPHRLLEDVPAGTRYRTACPTLN